MPLQDHFAPKLRMDKRWEPLLGFWPGMIVMRLRRFLPAGYMALPRIHRGRSIEIDVAAYEGLSPSAVSQTNGHGPSAAWAPEAPSLALETDFLDLDDFAVHLHEQHGDQRLVATVELVSPANKDRPSNRRDFAAVSESPLGE